MTGEAGGRDLRADRDVGADRRPCADRRARDHPNAWRSVLFVPGDRPDRIGKALTSGADAVCIDLEDAVAPAHKSFARKVVAELVTGDGPPVVVRVNDLDSSIGMADVDALRDLSRGVVDALMVPKVRRADALGDLWRRLGRVAPLIPLVETAHGLERAAEIACAGPFVAALVFGGFDLATDLGAEPEWEPLLYARSRVVHAAALAGVPAFDMPSRDLAVTEALAAEAEAARRLGFTGKTAIHPAQLPVLHEVFTPLNDEVARARRIVEVDRMAEGGAAALDGKMVDRPVVEAARRTLARAGARSTARGSTRSVDWAKERPK